MPWRMLHVLVLLCLAGCAANRINAADEPTRFTVHFDDVVARDFVGFGGQMNPYLYCRPNWTGSPTTRPAQGLVDEQNVAELERKVIELGPQHVRIFVQPEWWG